MSPLFPRGSEWRKWDLHVHSPLSALANEFPKLPSGEPDWEAYLVKLESFRDLPVVGITDYFTIEGYRKLWEFRRAGRLPAIQSLLANVEFRLDRLVGTNDGHRRLNYHVIFSEQVTPDEIDEHFLQEIKFLYQGDPQRLDLSLSLRRTNLELLGRRLKQEHAPFRDRGDFEIGCMNATVDPARIKDVLVAKADIFKDRYLIVLPEEHLSLLQWNGQDHQTRKLLLQGADAIFSANPGTIAWARGEGDLSGEQFRDEFKSLKPCIRGSDAHSIETIGRPPDARHCWIKADPTFEGLKQILYEPRERVYIGVTPERLKNDYQLIRSVRVSSQSWFSPEEVPINGDLVAVIGARGSGKSALGEVIALAAGSKVFAESPGGRHLDDMSESFLSKASRRSVVNPEPVVGSTIVVTWQEGQQSDLRIPVGLKHNLQNERVVYLPQKFVERLCAPENTERLEEQIETVIFQRMDPGDRLGASGFRELRSKATESIQLRKHQVRRAIQGLNRTISETSKQIALKPNKVRDELLRRNELDELLRSTPEPPIEVAGEVREREELISNREQLQGEIATLNKQIAALDSVDSRIEIVGAEIAAFNEEIVALIDACGLSEQREIFKVSLPREMKLAVQRKRSETQEVIRNKREGRAGVEAMSLSGVESRIRALNESSQLTEAKKREYEKFQKDKRVLEDAITSLGREVREIDDILVPRRGRDQEARLQKYVDYFDLLKDEQRRLGELYEPLQRALRGSDETARRLEFVSKITLNIQAQASAGYSLIDRRKVLREDAALESSLRDFFAAFEQGDVTNERAAEAVATLEADIFDSSGYSSVQDILRSDKRDFEYWDWLYDTDAFSVSYSMKYDGKDLQFLSPGEKGIVLLLLYLEAEEDDNRPLIIDQPDDNLDNLSVYPSLVEYFRKRKKTRQIIIITHNPNLVVNTDAEQVIVANFDGAREPKIQYKTGSLENTEPIGQTGIRQHVCKILEGGTEAFLRREQKYGIPD